MNLVLPEKNGERSYASLPRSPLKIALTSTRRKKGRMEKNGEEEEKKKRRREEEKEYSEIVIQNGDHSSIIGRNGAKK